MSGRSLERRLGRLERKRDLQVKQKDRPLFPSWFRIQLERQGQLDGAYEEFETRTQPVINPSAEWRYDALPAQSAFHAELKTRFKGYSGPIGSGKSYALAYEAIFLSLLNPGLLGLVGAPTYPMLQASTQRTFFEVLETEGLDYTFQKQENKLTLLANGSEVIFRTMENPERLRGPNLAWFAIDELTYCRKEVWTRLLGRLRHPQAHRLCGCGVWTPKGYDWVHRQFLEQKSPDYHIVLAAPQENRHLPADFYDRLQASYPERFYKQEVLGEYLDVFGGSAYYAFSEVNVRALSYNPHLPLCWALDFNVDPLCSVICQIEESDDRTALLTGHRVATVCALDEIILGDSNTVEAVAEFIRRTSHWQYGYKSLVVRIYGDASGHSRTTKSARTDYQLIREVFRQHPEYEISMRVNTANPAVKDRLNTVNAMLCSASGARQLWIDPKCRELIKDLRQVKWKRDSAGNPMGDLDKSDAQRTHVSDALSYLLAREFPMRAKVGERPGLLLC